MGEPFCLIDVRTESEYATAHIPGSDSDAPARARRVASPKFRTAGCRSRSSPSTDIRSRPRVAFWPSTAITSCSTSTAASTGGPGPLAAGINGQHLPHQLIAPTPWLVDNFHALPKGLALDVAMGNGRNAVYLATRGFDVDGVDVDPDVVAQARATARRFHAPIRAIIGNVEDGTYIIPMDAYDVIVVFNFLHRPLFRDIKDGLKPGGVVVYQTYLEEQIRFGRAEKPRAPAEVRRARRGLLRLRDLARERAGRFRRARRPALRPRRDRREEARVARRRRRRATMPHAGHPRDPGLPPSRRRLLPEDGAPAPRLRDALPRRW